MARTRTKNDEREHRILMEIVIDAYGPDERAMGWYYYLQDQLRFPFTATCIAHRAISPLRVKDEVDIIGISKKRTNAHTRCS